MKKAQILLRLLAAAVVLSGCASVKTERQHVIIIGVDGLSPAGIQQASTPIMDELCAQGACTFQARGVMPTKSSPNWASMVSGATPTQHGVTSNQWRRDKRSIEPVVTGMEDIFPTIFGVARQQKPGMTIGVVYDWKGFIRLIESSALDYEQNGADADETALLAEQFIRESSPDLLFVHFDHVDHAGHEIGHGSAAYLEAVSSADLLIGQLIEASKKAGTYDETTFIVTADHGGVGKGHGGESMDELLIPFMASGRNIRRGYNIEESVNTFDTAATAALLLGLDRPEAWVGRPVCTALEGLSCEP